MRAILIDPETKTLNEIQITDDHEEQCKLIMTARHRKMAEESDRTGDELFSGPWRLNQDGSDTIVINNYQIDDEPGFIPDDGDDRDVIHGRALAMHRNDGDLHISVAELTKRITFVGKGEPA